MGMYHTGHGHALQRRQVPGKHALLGCKCHLAQAGAAQLHEGLVRGWCWDELKADAAMLTVTPSAAAASARASSSWFSRRCEDLHGTVTMSQF